MKMHAAEPLVPESKPSEVEIAIAELRKNKSLGIDQILPKLIQAGDEKLRSEIH
jgi:hypothetical protein